jgi:hypothetical protein
VASDVAHFDWLMLTNGMLTGVRFLLAFKNTTWPTHKVPRGAGSLVRWFVISKLGLARRGFEPVTAGNQMNSHRRANRAAHR